MRGAKITVKCDCGQVNYLAYGERWTCPSCGRQWNTQQIPADEYWGIMRDARRQRVTMMLVAVALAVGFVVLGIAMGPAVWGFTPIVIAGWFLLLMPRWRRRLRIHARALPRWQLTPE